MKLIIAAIGASKAGPLRDLADDYAARARRAGPTIGFDGPVIFEGDAGKGLQGAARLNAESALLEKYAGGADVRVALDERGRNMSSQAFAEKLAHWRDDGRRGAAFLLGGADGHAQQTRAAADLELSFGAATWPHQLARVMLCEQIYRAITILCGHPYHRE